MYCRQAQKNKIGLQVLEKIIDFAINQMCEMIISGVMEVSGNIKHKLKLLNRKKWYFVFVKRGLGRGNDWCWLYWLVMTTLSYDSQAVLRQYVSTTLVSASSNYGDSWEPGQIIVNFYYIYNLSSFPACTADQEE